MLQSISKSISSTVQYVSEEESMQIDAVSSTQITASPHSKITGKVQNSPFIPTNRAQTGINSKEDVAMEIADKEKKGSNMRQNRNTTSTVSEKSEPARALESDINMSQTAPPAPSNLTGPLADKIDEGTISQIVAKVSDKNWKVRKEAYEKMDLIWKTKPFDDSATSSLLCHLEKLCQDSNASALDAGLQAVTSYIENTNSLQNSIVPSLMKGVIDKGFSGRPTTITLCESLIPKLIENGATEETVQALIEGTKHKKPKVPPACVSSLLQALQLFGPRIISIPALKSALPSLCESTVNNVRPLALKLLVEIHRWTGPVVIQDIVSNLRHAQQTEYEALTKDVVPGSAQPTKHVKGMAPKGEIGKSSNTSRRNTIKSKSVLPETSAMDPRDFVDAVNLTEKLAKTEYKAKIGSTKWKDKVAALKIVLEVIGPVPKLANGDYGDLVATLKLLSQDSNVNIVATSFEVVGALADGLRRQFTHYARGFVPILMSKLSDKKTIILQATNSALDIIQKHVIPLDQQMEDLRTWVDPMKNKAPQARVQTLRFIERSLISTEDQDGAENCVMTAYVTNLETEQQNAIFTTCGQMLCQAAEDVDPTVRKAAVEAIVKLYNVSNGSSALQQQLAAISKSNIRAYKAIEAGLAASGNASTSVADCDTNMKSVPDKEPKSTGSTTRRRSTLGGKKAPASNTSTTHLVPNAPSSGSVTESSGKASMTAEESEDILSDVIGAEWPTIQVEITSTKWTERKHAIELLEAFAATQNLSFRVLEGFVCYLSAHTKDFKDSNINVLKSTFQAIGSLASHSSRFPKSIVSMLLPPSVDKLSDRKVSDTVRRMIVAFSEATHPEYVVSCILAHITLTKSPLVHIEVVEVISTLIKDFGMAHCGPRALVEYIKGTQGLESSNAKCRSASIALLGTMYRQVGPAILPILQLDTWKPALATLAEKEFEKTGYDASAAMDSVVRSARGSCKETPDESGNVRRSSNRKKNTETSVMDVFGRQDISNLITKELLSDLKCEDDKAAWKKRLVAMESVQSICEQTGCAIEFTKSVGELIRALKPRLSDSNANLKVKAAQVVGILATSIGPEIAKFSKLLGPTLLNGCSDNKKNLQTASLDTLQRWVKHQSITSIGCMESLLLPLSEQLLNPVGRADVLNWAAENLKSCSEQQTQRPMDLTVLIVPTVQCLLDRSPETREKAQQLLLEVLRSVGVQIVLSVGCRDIKPAKMRTLQPLILKLMESVTEARANAMNQEQEEDITMQAPSTSSNNDDSFQHENEATMSSGIKSLRGIRQHGGRLGALRAGRSLRRSVEVRVSTPKDSTEEPEKAQGGRESINEGVSLSRCSENQKAARLAKAQYSRWIFDSTSQSEMNTRKSEIESDWRPYCSRELADQLFAESLEKGMMAGISNLLTCLMQQPDEIISVLDLMFKWITLRIVDNNVQALAKVLELLVSLFTLLQKRKYVLGEAEAGILLPFVLQESGHAKPRFRLRYRELLRQISDVFPCEKYASYLLDCINTTKNMKSRCECIDMVEYVLSNDREVSSVGKKIIREIAKLVTAHERDVRECAINAMVAAFYRTDGNLERFFRLVQVSTQQGMDLIRAKIKHLPPNEPPSQPHLSQCGGKDATRGKTIEMESSFTVGSTSLAHDDDVMMDPYDCNTASQSDCLPETVSIDARVHEDAEDTQADNDGVEALLMRPMRKLITKDVKSTEDEVELQNGIDAIKGLYAIASCPSDTYEVEFLTAFVNEIVQKLCECIRVSFQERKSDQIVSHLEAFPPFDIQMRVLSLSVTTLRAVLKNRVVADHLQRYTIERMLLVGCSTLQHPCLQDACPNVIQHPDKQLDTPDKKRHYMIIRALYILILDVLGRVKAGEVFPSIINLLQRIIRNDVGDFSAYNSYNHLMKKDSLDQLIGRILVHVSKQQAAALVPFEGVNLFGVLMQMHSFFATLPQSHMFAAHGADEKMQEALLIIASSISKVNPSFFQKCVQDLPSTSPVLTLLSRNGVLTSKETSAVTNGSDTTVINSLQSMGDDNSPERAQDENDTLHENVSRRLFHGTSLPSPKSNTSDYASIHDGTFEESSHSTLLKTQRIRERLDRVRKF